MSSEQNMDRSTMEQGTMEAGAAKQSVQTSAGTGMDKMARMKELCELLTRAGQAYYQEGAEIMSNYEYDALYDELSDLEKETGIVLAGSPTTRVGYEAVDELPKQRHERPMLSLDKTKDVEVLRAFVGSQKTLISWKLDGLTVVLTYRQGKLALAVTRGNGEVGEVITPNARVFRNIPLTIAYQGELVLRGEAVISYPDFQKINEEIEEEQARYKNPRNLCSGSVRQLSNEITAKRNVRFYAFGLVQAEGVDFENSHAKELEFLAGQGFDTVEYKETDADGLDAVIDYFREKIQTYEIPSDGLVALYDDIAYGASLGRTAKFPRNAFAFKWKDETAVTHLRQIEWSASRTGLINPVAVFDPVELEGTTVTRASVHNVSIVRSLQLGIGDEISVYKANMIIPQIAQNLTRSGTAPIPDHCPVCGAETQIHDSMDVQTLYCPNPDCAAKHIKAFELFVSRDAMNMEGLSEATLEKFIDAGILHRFPDLFHLEDHKETIVSMEGFGEKSYAKLAASVERARETTLPKLLYSLGIEGIGLAGARLICRFFGDDVEKIRRAGQEELSMIDGIGPVLAGSFVSYFALPQHQQLLDDLLGEVKLAVSAQTQQQNLAGKVFVVTGSVNHFANRSELKEAIEAQGGKVTGSVSANTDYLVNNDVHSTSTKNRKAAQLGIPVITEEELLEMLGRENNS